VTERPPESEFAPFYKGYVELVPEADVVAVLEAQADEIRRVASSVRQERETYRYGEGKWSVREVFGHLVDAERVFGYRAFCFSRGEQAALPSFDENRYVAASRSDATPLGDLVDELALVRRSNLIVFQRLQPAEWTQAGTASGRRVTVRALAWILAGHVRHHLAILRERYGVA
jgi:hypothetical protein